MDDDMYDEFGNIVTSNNGTVGAGAAGSAGDDIMDQEWLNEMNQLQLDEDSDEDDGQDLDGQPKDSMIVYQGNDLNNDVSGVIYILSII
jgi:hypothetical protein